jgi:rubrerythrin
MSLGTLLERFAACERRALDLYRRLAEHFSGDPEAARLWVELSNAEAAHFAILQLAADTARMAGGGEVPGAAPDEPVETIERTLTSLEVRAASGAITPAEAVEMALTLEREELPRIRRIVRALPPGARAGVMGGILLGLPAHYACLARLAARAGVPAAGAALEALADEARQLAGTQNEEDT